MANTNDRRTMFDRVRDAFKTKDAKAFDEAMKEFEKTADEDPEAGHHIEAHIHMPPVAATKDAEPNERMDKLEKKVDDGFKSINDAIAKIGDGKKTGDDETEASKAILGELEMEAPPGAGDSARKANDSALLTDSFQRTAADAEILAPGIRVPTFDSKEKPGKSLLSICKLRASALDLAYAQPETRGMIEQVMSGRALDTKTMTCGDTRTVFNAVAAMKKAANNDDNAGVRAADARTAPAAKGAIRTMADLNRLADEMYGRNKRVAVSA